MYISCIALVIFCVARVVITINPELNIDLEPHLLNEYLYLCIKLNDLIVLTVWALVSYISTKSICGVLQMGSFRRLFFNGGDVGVVSVKSAVVCFLTAVSVGYIINMVYFIYKQWSEELNPLLQQLQMFPALLMGFQSLCQGLYLLVSQDATFQYHEKSKQLMDHICLNFSFILHSLCITIVVRESAVESKILLKLVIGEVVYRIYAMMTFYKLKQLGEQNKNTDILQETGRGRTNSSEIVLPPCPLQHS